MSAESFPWDVLGLTSAASEKDVRRAYAVRLKQIDTAENPDDFEVLRRAYEFALLRKRMVVSPPEPADEFAVDDAAVDQFEDEPEDGSDYDPATLPPTADYTIPFKSMQSLVEARDYSYEAWQRLLNDPLLDTPGANSAFEHALVVALSENELKAEGTLSASKAWRDLIETRYAWASDGLRYTQRFPYHADLRQALVELRRSSTPLPYSPVPEKTRSGWGLWAVVVLLFLLVKGIVAYLDSNPG